MKITKTEEELLAMLELDTKHLLNDLEDMFSIPPVQELRFSLEEWYFRLRDEAVEKNYQGLLENYAQIACHYFPVGCGPIEPMLKLTPQQLIVACLLALREADDE